MIVRGLPVLSPNRSLDGLGAVFRLCRLSISSLGMSTLRVAPVFVMYPQCGFDFIQDLEGDGESFAGTKVYELDE